MGFFLPFCLSGIDGWPSPLKEKIRIVVFDRHPQGTNLFINMLGSLFCKDLTLFKAFFSAAQKAKALKCHEETWPLLLVACVTT